MTDPTNVGMLILLLAIACYCALAWTQPMMLSWIAGKLMARRDYILSGRIARAETWREWERNYGRIREGGRGDE